MICKFLDSKTAHGAFAVDYCLNAERVKDSTARIIKGDELETRLLIQNNQYKHKACFGVLSFSESADEISEQKKLDIINDFERNFLGDFMLEHINILWVEHSDKNNRLELNFIIPCIELKSGKNYMPYTHKRDFARLKRWQETINLENNFTSPSDPARALSFKCDYQQEQKGLLDKYNTIAELDNHLKELVKAGVICNRNEILENLKNIGCEITRAGKDYISVKLPNTKKATRLKGGIYNEQFTNAERLNDISNENSERAREFNSRNTQEYIAENRAKIKHDIEYINAENRKRYKEITRHNSELINADELNREHRHSINQSLNENATRIQNTSREYQQDRNNNALQSTTRADRNNEQSAQQNSKQDGHILNEYSREFSRSSKNNIIETKSINNIINSNTINQQSIHNYLSNNEISTKDDNDSIRASTIRRIREQEQFNNEFERIQERAREFSERIRELRELISAKTQRHIDSITERTRKHIENITEQFNTRNKRHIDSITERFKRRTSEHINDITKSIQDTTRRFVEIVSRRTQETTRTKFDTSTVLSDTARTICGVRKTIPDRFGAIRARIDTARKTNERIAETIKRANENIRAKKLMKKLRELSKTANNDYCYSYARAEAFENINEILQNKAKMELLRKFFKEQEIMNALKQEQTQTHEQEQDNSYSYSAPRMRMR